MSGSTFIGRRTLIIAILGAGVAPALGQVQMDQVKASMAALKAKTAQLGTPKISGSDAAAGKDVAALYFGTTKMNNSVEVVDEVVKEHSGTATLFVKSGNEYVRVATNVKKDDGSRAIGTVLDPNGPVFLQFRRARLTTGTRPFWASHTSRDTSRSGTRQGTSLASTMSAI
jgi:hypothetical protein